MRLNPNPRLEKLKDFRRHSDTINHIYRASPGERWWWNNRRERVLRREWRDHRWDLEDREDLTFTKFSHRHSALWDIY